MELWDAIAVLVAQGTDVLLTTQYLDEADHLANRIVIVDQGRVVADGSPAALKQRVGRTVVEIHVRHRHDLPEVARSLSRLRRPGDADVVVDEATRTVSTDFGGTMGPIMQALASLTERGLEVEDVAVRQPKLDEVFLALTGQPLQNQPPDPHAASAA